MSVASLISLLRLPVGEANVAALHAEANERYRGSVESRSESARPRLDGGLLRTARRFRTSTAGDVLNELHEGPWCDFLAEALARDCLPTRSSYIYYAPGDYVGPHHDVSQCEITGLVSLGRGGFTLSYPDVDVHAVDLDGFFEEVMAGSCDREVQLPLPANTVTFIPGTRLIHARRPSPAATVTVAACYILA